MIESERTRTKWIENVGAGRQYFLDVLRVAATCAVVLMHTLTGAVDAVDISQYPAERLVYLVTMDLITWCVPVFLLISGYLFLNPDRSISFPLMLTKYCRRIVLALFVFGVPYAILELMLGEGTFRFSMIGQGIWMVLQGKSWSHMWYLYLILLLYLITPTLKWLLKRMPKVCVYGILAVVFIGSSIFPFLNKWMDVSLPVLPDGGIYFFYYLCGYLFVVGECKEQTKGRDRHEEKEKRKVKRKNNVVLGLLIIILLGMAGSRVCWDFSLQMAYNYPFTVLVSLLIFKTGRSREISLGEKATVLWKRAGDLCFTIYLVHPVFVNVLYKFLGISLLDFPIGISLPLFFLGVLLLAAAAAWILCKVPILKKYVL